MKPPKYLYKYMYEDFANKFPTKGEVVLSSSRFFWNRYERNPHRDPSIDDPNEGRVEFVQTEPFDTQSANAGGKAIVSRHFGIDPNDTGRYVLRNNVVSEQTGDFFMLCFTKIGPPRGNRVFCESLSGYPPFDACVRISNVENFFKDLLIGAQKIIALPSGPHVDIHRDFDIFHSKHWHVTYTPVNRDWALGATGPTPFNKDPIFRNQREYRMVMRPNRSVKYEQIKFISPAISKHLKRVM